VALALRSLAQSEYIDDVLAVGNGALNGYLVDKNQAWVMLIKDIVVALTYHMDIHRFSKLAGSSEGFLGLVLYSLIKGR